MKAFDESMRQLLLDLLKINTVTPMETGAVSQIGEAQAVLIEAGRRYGLAIEYFHNPTIGDFESGPQSIEERYRCLGEAFLTSQPSLVLRAGSPQPRAKTIMFNFHIDTVGGDAAPVEFRNGRFYGRGAADAKGPGVGILAGIAAALRESPAIASEIQILLQSVSGEEGGAMGFYGTRPLIDRGYTGRLNIFAEPSGARFFDRSTASMTLAVRVNGAGATDDEPASGVNATLLLSYVTQFLARRLSADLSDENVKLCVAGISTGSSHNRVYGTGNLLLNFAYEKSESGKRVEEFVDRAFNDAIQDFRRGFEALKFFSKTAKEAKDTLSYEWLKRGLPVLNNRDAGAEYFLTHEVGIERVPEADAQTCFTCDAIWGSGLEGYTIVYGPGDLGLNHAHAAGEFIELSELERYAESVKKLILQFAAREGLAYSDAAAVVTPFHRSAEHQSDLGTEIGSRV